MYRQARRYLRDVLGDWPDVVIDSINTCPFRAADCSSAPVVALAYQVCREIWFDEFPFGVAMLGRYVIEPRWLRRYRQIPTMTISPSSRASLRRYGLRNLHLVPVGTSIPPPTHTRKADEPTVAFVGRLVPNRRPDHALAAFSELRWRCPGAQLWIIGSGPLELQLRADAPDGVTFFGRVSEQEKADLLAQAHVLIATSRREGWGLTVTEAAAVGTPAVCYDIAGLRDSVAATGGGRLTPCTPPTLAAEIADFLGDATHFPPVVPPSWQDSADACMAVLQDSDRAGSSTAACALTCSRGCGDPVTTLPTREDAPSMPQSLSSCQPPILVERSASVCNPSGLRACLAPLSWSTTSRATTRR